MLVECIRKIRREWPVDTPISWSTSISGVNRTLQPALWSLVAMSSSSPYSGKPSSNPPTSSNASRGISRHAPETQSTSRSDVRSQPSMWYRRVKRFRGRTVPRKAWATASVTRGNGLPLGYTVPSMFRRSGPRMPAWGRFRATSR
jgi:hypothetical protein